MFGTGIVVRLRRWLGWGAPPVAEEPPPPPAPEPDPPAAEESASWLKSDLDWEAMAQASTTRFEKIYYRRTGRAIFKWRHYLPVYDQVLTPYVGRPLTLVEIGVANGGSIDLWREFLGKQIRIIGVDNNPECLELEAPGVEIMIGSQADPDFLAQVAERAGPIDIVIDDGSHICSHQITAMGALFPHVRDGGLYVCEDLHTSYWREFEGGLKTPGSFIEFTKDLIDRVHHRWNGIPLPPDDLAHWIGAMTLADSMAVFHKTAPSETFMAHVGG